MLHRAAFYIGVAFSVVEKGAATVPKKRDGKQCARDVARSMCKPAGLLAITALLCDVIAFVALNGFGVLFFIVVIVSIVSCYIGGRYLS